MPLTDVFNQNAFKVSTLTHSMNLLPYKPGRVGAMNLFTGKGVKTNVVVIEERQGTLALLTTKRRGVGGRQLATRAKRKVRSFNIPHIPYDDEILASDAQDVREFGSEDRMQAVRSLVTDQLQVMRQDHENTHEYHRVGAISGKVLEPDGSTVITDLFTEFSTTEQTEDFILDTSTTDVKAKCISVRRKIETALGLKIQGVGVHALCGQNFFDSLTSHALVKTAYERWQAGEQLRSDMRDNFRFAGITFEEYSGAIGGTDFINTENCRFFPVGVPNLFIVRYGPADFSEAVNTIGKLMYAKQERMEFDRGIKLHTQSNPLFLCTRPRCLVKGIRDAP